MPIGLRLLQIFTIFNLVFSVGAVMLLKFLAMNVSWFPDVLSGTTLGAWMATALGSVIILLAIRFTHAYLYYLVFIVFGMNIVLTVRGVVTQTQSSSSIITLLSGLAPYLVFAWYWSRIRTYYFGIPGSEPSVKQADVSMKWMAIIGIICYLTYAVISTVNAQKAKYLQKMDIIKFMKLLDGQPYKEMLKYCEVSVPVQSKNSCFFAAFGLTENKSMITLDDCNRLTDETYTFSCYAMGGHCDELTDPTFAESCASLTKSLYTK